MLYNIGTFVYLKHDFKIIYIYFSGVFGNICSR